MDIAPDLLAKLSRLITPPGIDALPVVTPGCDVGERLPGAIVVGDLGEAEWSRLYRALLPGAHVVLFPADPVGDAAACAAEDAGMEVRDAIFLAQHARDLVMVPKASRREREDGLWDLPARPGHEAVKRKKGSAGLKNARAGAGRTAKEVKNHHPTTKPVGALAEVLRRLGVQEGPVVDPFAGTGTTSVACIRAGIRSISIERDPEFAPVGRAKVSNEMRRRPG